MMPSIEPGSNVEPRARIWSIIFMTGSFGMSRGIKNTTVIPSQMTRTYEIKRGIK